MLRSCTRCFCQNTPTTTNDSTRFTFYSHWSQENKKCSFDRVVLSHTNEPLLTPPMLLYIQAPSHESRCSGCQCVFLWLSFFKVQLNYQAPPTNWQFYWSTSPSLPALSLSCSWWAKCKALGAKGVARNFGVWWPGWNHTSVTSVWGGHACVRHSLTYHPQSRFHEIKFPHKEPGSRCTNKLDRSPGDELNILFQLYNISIIVFELSGCASFKIRQNKNVNITSLKFLIAFWEKVAKNKHTNKQKKNKPKKALCTMDPRFQCIISPQTKHEWEKTANTHIFLTVMMSLDVTIISLLCTNEQAWPS